MGADVSICTSDVASGDDSFTCNPDVAECEDAITDCHNHAIVACDAKHTSMCSSSPVRQHKFGVELKDHYELGPQVGEGAFASVWRCNSMRTGVSRACKATAKAEGHAQSAYTEVDILKLLQRGGYGQARIVRLFEVFEDDRAVYLILELCCGGDLHSRRMEAGRFEEIECKHLMKQMLIAVAHIHMHRVAHRDLKLENWLFVQDAPETDLRLCDFGLAAVLRCGEFATDRVGSVQYVAPEVLKGEYDTRADLWSMGVILYMLLSGTAPFTGKKQQEVLFAIIRREINFRLPVWDKVSADAKAMVNALLTTEPLDRPTALMTLTHPWMLGGSRSTVSEPPPSVHACSVPPEP